MMNHAASLRILISVIKASRVGHSNAEHGTFELSVGIELVFDCREDGRFDGM